MPVLAIHLESYGFERIGELRELHPRDIPAESGLYGFVALGEVRSPPLTIRDDPQNPGYENAWVIRLPGEGEGEVRLQASELFYIGATDQGLRKRLSHYRRFVKGYHTEKIRRGELKKMTRVNRVLRDICLQRILVDVYVRAISKDIVYVQDNVPVDPLLGMEAALIRMFVPFGNEKHRLR
jgi:hypothetical protein